VRIKIKSQDRQRNKQRNKGQNEIKNERREKEEETNSFDTSRQTHPSLPTNTTGAQ
jgi:hypothetical protein